MGDIFRGSFDVAVVDPVFEVCVFDAHTSSETVSRAKKKLIIVMTPKKKEKNAGILTEICIKSGSEVRSRF